MAIVDSVGRLAGTLVGILHTRLGLIAVEVEEEMSRFSSYLLWSLVALFCGGIAVLLGVLLVVALFWDTHRIEVLMTLIALFAASAMILVWRLSKALKNKPRLLAYSLNELSKDVANLRGDAEQAR
ncbi:phage holin family protein [Undibacterium sp.]|uniref:phage holin family protein n=1 Tax=Undibacterium sp. TaxID=1914977 RepID=UPI0025DF1F01|nr:phage holin family protein [Undibacterium sp.]